MGFSFSFLKEWEHKKIFQDYNFTIKILNLR